MSVIDNITIKPRRVPSKRAVKKGAAIAEYVIVSCELCDTEIAMARPFASEPVRCAAHDHDRPNLRVDEDVLAIESDCE